MVVGDALADLVQLEADDGAQHLVADRQIGHDGQAAEEGRLEHVLQRGAQNLHQVFRRRIAGFALDGDAVLAGAHHQVGAGIGGQQDDGVLEVDFAALAVFQQAFVEDLEEQLQHVGVGFFHLVQQHHRVGLRRTASVSTPPSP